MADFSFARSPTLGGQWSKQYGWLVDQTEAYANQIDNANQASEQGSLSATFALYSTTAAMEEYVQGIALAGVPASEVGSASDIVTINETATGFTGKNFDSVEPARNKKLKKWSKYNVLLTLNSFSS
jgi:hypothetical protein